MEWCQWNIFKIKNLNSKLFEKKQVKNEELKNIQGCGVETPCGPGGDGNDYKDHCADDGRMFYKECD